MTKDNELLEKSKRHFQPPASEALIHYRKNVKANQIIGLIQDHVSENKIYNALSIGASYCLIEEQIHNSLMPQAKFYCIDVDKKALESFDQPSLIKKFMSATAIDFPQDTFNFIMAQQVLEHINDYQAVLQSINRICRPNGIVFINVPNPFSPFIVAKTADGSFARPFLKFFIRENSKKFKKDYLTNTEKYHTGFTENVLRKHLPGFKVIDKRRVRLKQELKSSFLRSFVANVIPSKLLFLIVPTNIWVLAKEK